MLRVPNKECITREKSVLDSRYHSVSIDIEQDLELVRIKAINLVKITVNQGVNRGLDKGVDGAVLPARTRTR